MDGSDDSPVNLKENSLGNSVLNSPSQSGSGSLSGQGSMATPSRRPSLLSQPSHGRGVSLPDMPSHRGSISTGASRRGSVLSSAGEYSLCGLVTITGAFAKTVSTVSTSSISEDAGTVISIKEERERPNANPTAPSFIHDPNLAQKDLNKWMTVVLPYVSSLIFMFESLTDVHFFRAIMASPNLPQLFRAVTKISFKGFYWFSGIAHNRTANPYLEICAGLPNLQELTLTFHTAGLTTSRWHERERIKMEATDLEKSKELKVLRVTDVSGRYDLAALWRCPGLQVLHLECLNSPIVAHFVKVGDPLGPFRDLVHFLSDGFRQYCGTQVQIDLKVIDIEG